MDKDHNMLSQDDVFIGLGGYSGMDLRGSSRSLDQLMGRLGASMASRSDAGPLSSLQPQGLWSEALTNATATSSLQCLLPTEFSLRCISSKTFPEVSLTSNDYDNLP